VEEMDNIQGVLIKGMGDGRAFCAGGDVRAAVTAARGGDVGVLTLPSAPLRLCSR
jgi:enoyl-CoA hydratase/carnithine racemase